MKTATRWSLVLILLLTGASAIWGGYLLIAGGWDLDPAWLRYTPFETWLLPGVATILFPGVCVILAGLAVLFRVPGYRLIAMVAGLGLVAWILVELAWLRVLHPVMHPLIFGIGVLVAVLAWLLPRDPAAAPAGAGTIDAPQESRVR